MSINNRLKQFVLQRGIIAKKAVAPSEVERFQDRFKENYVSVDLVRVGGSGDGGYLVPDVLDQVSHCFSPGVEYKASFESELSNRFGIKSFMADASVSEAPVADPNFHMISKFLGSNTKDDFITLSDWMADSLDGSEGDLILQMDIEGSEYEVLAFESLATLSRFCVMVVEFHSLQSMFDRHFLKMLTGIFEKLYGEFAICHVHPNNCCGIASFKGVSVPRAIEVTFLRQDLVDRCRNGEKVQLPHILDERNWGDRDDITMPEKWWR